MLKVKIKREVDLRKYFTEVDGDAKKMAAALGDTYAERVVKYVRAAIMSGPVSGRLYSRSNPRRIHRASAPGEAPAHDLGNLTMSYGWEKKKVNQHVSRRIIGSSSIVAQILEFGVPGKNLAERPHLRPAVEKANAELDQMIEEVKTGVFK